jgi:hypothetical protein
MIGASAGKHLDAAGAAGSPKSVIGEISIDLRQSGVYYYGNASENGNFSSKRSILRCCKFQKHSEFAFPGAANRMMLKESRR